MLSIFCHVKNDQIQTLKRYTFSMTDTKFCLENHLKWTFPLQTLAFSSEISPNRNPKTKFSKSWKNTQVISESSRNLNGEKKRGKFFCWSFHLNLHCFKENVVDVIIYSNPDAHDGRKNRGFCFVDFTDHKAASDAKWYLLALMDTPI